MNRTQVERAALPWRGDMVVALVLLAAHTVAIWGYSGLFWGDLGRWSHEVERFALGELPYRDFQWHFPPLAIWLIGGAARVSGTSRDAISVATSSVAVGIVMAFVGFVRRVLGRANSWFTGAALLLALSFVQRNGAPLQLGSYSPAISVGGLCIALATLSFVHTFATSAGDPGKARDASEQRHALALGVFSGLAVLSKQDFWIPAAYLVAANTWRTRRLHAAAAAALVTGAGMGVVAFTAGAATLLPLAGGFGHVQMAGGEGWPSWERLTIEVLVLALLVGSVAAIAGSATRRQPWRLLAISVVVVTAAAALHLTMTMGTALPSPGALRSATQDALFSELRDHRPMLRPAIGFLRARMADTPLPLLLPLFLLAVLARRWRELPRERRVLIALLLGLALAFRARRAFQGSDWIEFLFSLPTYLAAAELLLVRDGVDGPRLRRRLGVTLAALALWAHVEHGRGLGTRRHYPASFVSTRGTMHWKPNEIVDHETLRLALDSLDPSGRRPLHAFGYSGGMNYFLRRRNPFPITQDYFLSAFDADSVLRHVPPGLLLIDNPVFSSVTYNAPGFDWRHWEQPRITAPYTWFDRPRFEGLKRGCREVRLARSMFRLFDCAVTTKHASS